jgi:hypothetical protein
MDEWSAIQQMFKWKCELFTILKFMNKPAMNIHVKISLIQIFIFLEQITKGEKGKSCKKKMYV